MYTTMIHGQRP